MSTFLHVFTTHTVVGYLLSFVDSIETMLRLRQCCRALRHACTHVQAGWDGRVLFVDTPNRLLALQMMRPVSLPHLQAVQINTYGDALTWFASLTSLVNAAPSVTSLHLEFSDENVDVQPLTRWKVKHLNMNILSLDRDRPSHLLLQCYAPSILSLVAPHLELSVWPVVQQMACLESLAVQSLPYVMWTLVGKLHTLRKLSAKRPQIDSDSAADLISRLNLLVELDLRVEHFADEGCIDYRYVQRCPNHTNITRINEPVILPRMFNTPAPTIAGLTELCSLQVLSISGVLSNAYLQQLSHLPHLKELRVWKAQIDLDPSCLSQTVANNITTLQVPTPHGLTMAESVALEVQLIRHFPHLTRLYMTVPSVYDSTIMTVPVAAANADRISEAYHMIQQLTGPESPLTHLLYLTLYNIPVGCASSALPLLVVCSNLESLSLQIQIPVPVLRCDRQVIQYKNIWLPVTKLTSQLSRLHTLRVLSVSTGGESLGCNFTLEEWQTVVLSMGNIKHLAFYYQRDIHNLVLALSTPSIRLCSICTELEFYDRWNGSTGWDGPDDDDDVDDDDHQDGQTDVMMQTNQHQAGVAGDETYVDWETSVRQLNAYRSRNTMTRIRWSNTIDLEIDGYV